jgi:flavin-dependent dehydrogenase
MQIQKKSTTIIGGSVAGSYLAIVLGMAGHKVNLIEPAKMPRRKACGEGMAACGRSYLDVLGIWDSTFEDLTEPFNGYRIYRDQAEEIYLGPPRSFGGGVEGYTIRRDLFDMELFRRATLQTTVSLINEKVRSVSGSVGKWLVETSRGSIESSNLVFACGTGIRGVSYNGESLASEPLSSDRVGLVLWYSGKWEGDQRPKNVCIKHCERSQIIVTPLPGNCVNVSILMTKNSLGQSILDQTKHLTEESQLFLEKLGFKDRVLIETRGAASIASHQPGSIPEGAYAIGDSAEVFDPIGGMGIAHAFGSATLASEAILNEGVAHTQNCKRYHYERKHLARRLQVVTALSYELNVSQGSICTWAVRCFPRLAYRFLGLVKSRIPFIDASEVLQDCYQREDSQTEHGNQQGQLQLV